jgi:hypothetical protein
MKIGGLRVDTQEVQGPFCKVAGIKEFPDLIFNGKFRGLSPQCSGPRAAPVYGGPRTGPRRRLAGERPKWHTRAWNLAAVKEKGGGNGGEPHRLQEGAAEGRKQPGISGEKPMEEVLGAGGARGRREEKRGGERSGEARGGCSPFYRGRGGACQGEKGGNGRRQWP